MNTKFFVPYETAEALQFKGYPQEIDTVFSDGSIIQRNGVDAERMNMFNIIAAPTYHEVVDWFDRKGLYITALYFEVREEPWTAIIDGKEHALCGVFSTREEALNAAILKALEVI